jgi:hypothetical protein
MSFGILDLLAFAGFDREVRARMDSGTGDVPPGCDWALKWREETQFFYHLNRISGFEEYEGRVVIDWGRGTLSWCQKLSNKPVLQLLAPGRTLPPFEDYLEFSLTFDELQLLFANEDAHSDWRAQLRAVGAVYLILAEGSGDLYIGSASGEEGLWGRWREYARTGHGNNRLLQDLVALNDLYPSCFRFSILQILPKTMTRTQILEREAIYKEKLGSRAHGLNLN